MTLLQAWSDSLSLLKPKNFKLFLLVTVKSIIDAYRLLIKYWWWLIAIMIILPLLFDMRSILFLCAHKILFVHTFFEWFYQILLFATLVATRPSLEKKDGAYFNRYIAYFVLVIPFLVVLPQSARPSAISPIYFFMILFYLDSSQGLKSILMSFFRAIKMVVYNFPLLFIVGAMLSMPTFIAEEFGSIWFLLKFFTLGQIFSLLAIIKTILLPISVCLYANIYIKKLHDQFDLYCKQPI